jgi:hypothetical protein
MRDRTLSVIVHAVSVRPFVMALVATATLVVQSFSIS